MNSETSAGDRQRLDWLVANFARTDPSIIQCVVVTTDGLLLATSKEASAARSTQVSALTSGICGLTGAIASQLEFGRMVQTIVQMEHGILLIRLIGDSSCLAVVASPDCDVEAIAYEMVTMVVRIGHVLTPALRAELQETAAT